MCEPGRINFLRIHQTAIIDRTRPPLTEQDLLDLIRAVENPEPEYVTIWQREDDDAD